MSKNVLDKIGSLGGVIAGTAMTYCYPFLSLFILILGLGIFASYEKWIFYGIQAVVLLSLVGSLNAYKRHRKVLPLILSILSTASIIYGINSMLDTVYMYSGMVGLLIVSVWNSIESKRFEAECKV